MDRPSDWGLTFDDGYDTGYRDGLLKGHRSGYEEAYQDVSADFETRIRTLNVEILELNARLAVLEKRFGETA